MSSQVFGERTIPIDRNLALPSRRLASSIIAEFPWQTEDIVLNPTPFVGDKPVIPGYQLFASALHEFEKELFKFDARSDSVTLLRLLGIVIPHGSIGPASSIILKHEDTLTVGDYQKLASFLAAYRFYEILCIRNNLAKRIPPTVQQVSMFLPPLSSKTSEELKYYKRLHNWPKLVTDFCRTVLKPKEIKLPNRRSELPMMSLLKMMKANKVSENCVAYADNFLFAALEIAALKHIRFKPGVLPDLPSACPEFQPDDAVATGSTSESSLQAQAEYAKFTKAYNEFMAEQGGEKKGGGAPVSFRNSFHLAILISPFLLLAPAFLTKKALNRRTVLQIASRLPRHRPPPIQDTEGKIMGSLFDLSTGDFDIEISMKDLALELQTMLASMDTEAIKDWFQMLTTDLPYIASSVDALLPSSSLPGPSAAFSSNDEEMDVDDIVGKLLDAAMQRGTTAGGTDMPVDKDDVDKNVVDGVIGTGEAGANGSDIPVDEDDMHDDVTDSNEADVGSGEGDGSVVKAGVHIGEVESSDVDIPAQEGGAASKESETPVDNTSSAAHFRDIFNNLSFDDAMSHTNDPTDDIPQDPSPQHDRDIDQPVGQAASPFLDDDVTPGMPDLNEVVSGVCGQPSCVEQHLPTTIDPRYLIKRVDSPVCRTDEMVVDSITESADPIPSLVDEYESDVESRAAQGKTAEASEVAEAKDGDDSSTRALTSLSPSNESPIPVQPQADAKSISKPLKPVPAKPSATNKSVPPSTSSQAPSRTSGRGSKRKTPSDGFKSASVVASDNEVTAKKDTKASVPPIPNFRVIKERRSASRLPSVIPSASYYVNRLSSAKESSEDIIVIDDIYTIFEPSFKLEFNVFRNGELPMDYVKQQESHKEYTAYDSRGVCLKFKPRFHQKEHFKTFDQFMKNVKTTSNGLPLFLDDSNTSVIVTHTYAQWMEKSENERQQILSKKNVVVSDWPIEEPVSFDEKGIRKIVGPMDRPISIQDLSTPYKSDSCTVDGVVRDLWEHRGPDGKILNALDLPLRGGNTTPTEYTSDLHAWDYTRDFHGVSAKKAYPTEEMRWALAGLKNTLSFLHADCNGLGTYIHVLCGGKVWGIVREFAKNPVRSLDFYTHEGFSIENASKKSEYRFETIVLRPNDKLYLLPGQPHFVYGYEDTLCTGGHYYLTHQMQHIFPAVIHTFMLHYYITNSTHPAEGMLRRLVIFYHMGLLENRVPSDDPSSSHLPDVKTPSGLLDLICACVLVVLGNVLDIRTYKTLGKEDPDSENDVVNALMDADINEIPLNERVASCYARGIALHILDWVRVHCDLKDPAGNLVEDFPSLFLHQTLCSLKRYHQELVDAELTRHCPFTSDLFLKQLDNVSSIYQPHWNIPNEEKVDTDYLGVRHIEEYSVEWSELPLTWTGGNNVFLTAGVTTLDGDYFRAQEKRHTYEKVLLPHIKQSYDSSEEQEAAESSDEIDSDSSQDPSFEPSSKRRKLQ